MANDLQNRIKNGLLTSSRLNNVVTNAPANTSPKYSKYNDEAAAYYHEYAPYASNVFEAEIQGLDNNDFYAWTKVHLRSSNVINPSTGENLSTSWQSILILDRKVDFIPIGAYVKYNNSVWIVYNPDNIASPTGNSIVIRCNTTYNTLDYYGNIVKTPMFFAKGTVLASSPYYMELSATLDGYQHVIMQLNDVTEKITNNTRLILGKSAFGMYGVSDFPEEFTGDLDSCHIFRADLRLQETVEADDLVNRVADGKYFSFTIDLGGESVMYVGQQKTIIATARRNGKVVISTEENPITYNWHSSDESVATVDENGTIIPNGVGYCQVTCSLEQNPNVSSVFGFNVIESLYHAYVDFTTPIPEYLKVFETLTVKAGCFVDGEEAIAPVTFLLSGADEESYSYEQNGNTLTIKTWKPSEKPLVIQAVYTTDDPICFTIASVDNETGSLLWVTSDEYNGSVLRMSESNLTATHEDGVASANVWIENGILYAENLEMQAAVKIKILGY